MVKKKVVGKNKNTKKNEKKFFQKYLDGELKLQKYQWVGIALLVVVVSGFLGWVWEFLLQEISGGFEHLYIKGGNLLPWLNIYAYGAIVVLLVAYRIRKYPWLVFLVSGIATGIVELIGGWWAYTFYDGARYWDYSDKWWGVGNINGFVCPVSAIIFGIGAMIFMYAILPLCIKIALEMTKRAFLTLSITLFVLVITDDITNLTLKNLGLPTAQNFYEWLGWVYK